MLESVLPEWASRKLRPSDTARREFTKGLGSHPNHFGVGYMNGSILASRVAGREPCSMLDTIVARRSEGGLIREAELLANVRADLVGRLG